MLAAYSSVLVCVYATYRIGLEQGWRWGVVHLLILVGFFLLFYGLESFAAARTPFFYYPPPAEGGFPDWIPFLPFGKVPSTKPCPYPGPENAGIPLSVLLLETTLVFAAAHTARLLADRKDLLFRVLRPFMVALALLLFDFFLDPLGASSRDCASFGAPTTPALGFWRWSVHAGLAPDGFGIPIFNYALWFSAPVILVALIGLLGWFYDLVFDPLIFVGFMIKLKFLLEGAFLTVILWAFSVIYTMAPDFATLPVFYLRLWFVGILLATLLWILLFRHFYNYENRFRWWFVYPQAVFLLFCLVALFLSGALLKMPSLGIVALVVSPIFAIWMLLPYWKTIFP